MNGVRENSPPIQTQRLHLRRFCEGDVIALHEILRDKKVNLFLPWFPSRTLAETEERLHEWMESYDREGEYRYALCRKEDGFLIGYVHVSGDASHDLGYGLRQDFWGKGIAVEACRAVLAKLQQDGVSYVTATHDVNNPASGAVMKKLGMTYHYSYVEQWKPKEIQVTFRMYQRNLNGVSPVYDVYWNRYPRHFIEKLS